MNLFSLKRLNATQLALGLSDEADEVLILEYSFYIPVISFLSPNVQLHLQRPV